MLSGKRAEDYTFPVEINLVLVKISKTKRPLVGVISDGYGKYIIPESRLRKNKSSSEEASALVHTFARVDASVEYNVELATVKDAPNRYIGDSTHHISLVFRAFLPESFEFYERIEWIDAEQIMDYEEKEKFCKDYADIIRTAMFNGLQ